MRQARGPIPAARTPPTMRSIGRFLQLAGLVILPIGSFLQLGNAISPGGLLMFLVVGAALFTIGWILRTYR